VNLTVFANLSFLAKFVFVAFFRKFYKLTRFVGLFSLDFKSARGNSVNTKSESFIARVGYALWHKKTK
jgi:hypothetical protein